jgi:acyl-coenzyme A synthetase/AMP-(fatty) acid ligase
MNGKMPAQIAVTYIQRLRAACVLGDAAHLRELADGGLDPGLLTDVTAAGSGDPAKAPPYYRHHADDPVAITHSSGTTRVPAGVVHSHASLFAATRLAHLDMPRAHEPVRTLSVLPAAHAAGIIAIQQGLCNRSELLFLSSQGGEFGQSGEAVLDAIERWRPTGVFGFAVTWAELARFDLTERDLSSVKLWFNTGDCAHEPHVRRLAAMGSHLAYTRDGLVRVPGSHFIDGIGSTEMGHSAFKHVHRVGTNRYGRCVGKPYPFADVVLLDLPGGAPGRSAPGRLVEVPVGQVGHLGLRSPTLALGYWNDSATTYRTRLGGYYLTGDLMYRDGDGFYYHVDRAVDSVDLGDGTWIYTAASEERILARCPGVRDCTVLAGAVDDAVVTDVFLQLHAGADARADRRGEICDALGEPAAATIRRVVVVGDDDMVVGPTGKVRKFLMRQAHLKDVSLA